MVTCTLCAPITAAFLTAATTLVRASKRLCIRVATTTIVINPRTLAAVTGVLLTPLVWVACMFLTALSAAQLCRAAGREMPFVR